MTGRDEEFRDYVTARLEPLRRTAYLLCRDWHTADDLVSITLSKLYRNWRRALGADNLDAYVRGMLTNAWLDERRRPWRRERSTDEVPDRADLAAGEPSVGEREMLLELLGGSRRADGRWWCSASTATCRSRRPRRSWASAPEP